MRVIGLALGSRGDVQPMAALLGGLRDRGFDTLLLAPRDLIDLGRAEGVPARAIAADAGSAWELTRSGPGRVLIRSLAGQAALLRRWMASTARAVADAALDAVAPGDLLVTGLLTRSTAVALARCRGCAMATLLYTAQAPTAHRESHFAPRFFTPIKRVNGWGASLGWRLASTLDAPVARLVARRTGVPPLWPAAATRTADRFPTIVAASPLVVPPAPDWPPHVMLTGYLTTPPKPVTAPPELLDFLAAGPPPVYVGFGSFGGALGPRVCGIALEAAHRSGRRLVIAAPPGQPPGRLADTVLGIAPIAHGWLFPQMAAVVHHGGAGTTWSGLCSGRPSAAVPFGVDQPFHGARLHALGAGPSPLPIRRLSGRTLAALIAALASGRFDDRAAALGELARAERGVDDTIAALRRSGVLPDR